jgi:hypothetical protein
MAMVDKKYPIHLVKYVREGVYDLDENDTSKDEEIQKMTPMEFFEHVCHYDGLLGSYPSTISRWINYIFGVDLNSVKRPQVNSKHFDESIHMLCPHCGAETIYIKPDNKTIGLVFKDGTIAPDSFEIDIDSKENDVEGIYCNSKYCEKKIEI